MKSKISAQKLRGGYYTPEEVTKFLSSWAIKTNKDRILEPSCGDGNFLISVVEKLVSLQATTKDCSEQISAIELDRKEYNKAIKRLATKKIALKTAKHSAWLAISLINLRKYKNKEKRLMLK